MTRLSHVNGYGLVCDCARYNSPIVRRPHKTRKSNVVRTLRDDVVKVVNRVKITTGKSTTRSAPVRVLSVTYKSSPEMASVLGSSGACPLRVSRDRTLRLDAGISCRLTVSSKR